MDRRKTTTISLYNINWFFFITETEYVYCAVRTRSLNIIQVNLSLKNAVPWLRWLVPGLSPRRPGFDPRSVPVLRWQGGTGTGISPRRHTSVSSYQYNCTIAPYDLHLYGALTIRTACDSSTKSDLPEIGECGIESTFFFCVFKGSISPVPKPTTTCKRLFKFYVLHAF
jgi:hypothetical protein